jgi:hypothetical protein
MEFATGGDLHSYIQEKKNLPEKHARWLFQQVLPPPYIIANKEYQNTHLPGNIGHFCHA